MLKMNVSLVSESGEASNLVKNIAAALGISTDEFLSKAGYSTYTFNEKPIMVFYYNPMNMSALSSERHIANDYGIEISKALDVEVTSEILGHFQNLAKYHTSILKKDKFSSTIDLKSLYTAIHNAQHFFCSVQIPNVQNRNWDINKLHRFIK